MKLLFALAALAAALPLTLMAAEKTSQDSPVYEMRVYYSPPGKIDALHARFRDHTLRLFEKHGIKSVGYWVPMNNPENKVVFVLEYPSREAREKSWKAFLSDPEWIAAAKKSEEYGPIVIGNKIESTFLKRTDYSPKPKIEKKGGRIFELRTYTTPEGKLDDLNARFRNHTVNLFEKHGMENIVYWTKMDDQKGADTTLIYLLAHKSPEAHKASFDAFRDDEAWKKAKTESEKNGSLTVPGGVKSDLMVPTGYSPMK